MLKKTLIGGKLNNTLEQSMDQRGNKKLSWDKWKGKHNIQKLMGCSKQSLKRKVHTNKHIKNQERSQVNNLTLHFKEPEKE